VRRAEPGSSADEPQRVGDPSRGADLSIAEIQDVPGEPSKLRVKIRNDGVVHSDATNLKVFYRRSGQQLVEGTPVPSIRPRSSVWLVVSAPGRIAAAQTVSLKVDDPDRVSESDEGNNSYRYK
jgi:subtilase family serine protease